MNFKIMSATILGMIFILSAVLIGQSNMTEIPVPGMGDKKAEQTDALNHMKIQFNTILGDTVSLEDYKGNVVMIVNVASECGNTPQYADLEKLYQKYEDEGLVVIGFPSNSFNQEPGTDEQIYKFCTSKFAVTFPMMSKVSVKGEDKHPLFVYLTEDNDMKGEIKWNFEKFILDKDGNLVARFATKVNPLDDEVVAVIEKELEAE